MYIGRGGKMAWYSGVGNEGGKIVETDIGSGGVEGDTR